jgi:hypothetical protein
MHFAKEVTAPFHNFGNFLEKIGKFDFFLCCTPCHVVREQMRENSLAQGNTQPTKKEETEAEKSDSDYTKGQDSSQKRNPGCVCQE